MPLGLSRELQGFLIIILPQYYQSLIFHRSGYMDQAQKFYHREEALR